MLVLNRKELETIRIGQAVITILATGPTRVSVGIEAPREIEIVRGEPARAGSGTGGSVMEWAFILGVFTGSAITATIAMAAAVSEWIWRFKE